MWHAMLIDVMSMACRQYHKRANGALQKRLLLGIVPYLGRLLTRIWAAQVPRIVRPLAGRATVSRASMSPCMYKVKVH